MQPNMLDLDLLKPQLDAMQEMYRAGFEAGVQEGKRLASAEFLQNLKTIQEGFDAQTPAAH